MGVLKATEDQDTDLLDFEDGLLHPSAPESGAKPGRKPTNVIRGGGIRSPSPDPAFVSVIESERLRVGLDGDQVDAPNGPRHASAPAGSFKGRAADFWARNKGLALVLLAQVFGTLMNVTTRLLEMEGNHGNGYHPFQILFARMSITVVCASCYMWYNKTEHFPLGQGGVRLLLVARGLTGFFGVFGLYYSLQYLPLADATVITFLAPSLSCWACSFFLKEPFTRMEQIAAYISLFGVVLIARPAALFSSGSGTPSPAAGNADGAAMGTNATVGLPAPPLAHGYREVTPAQRAGAVGMAMLGVLGATGAYTTLRWIGKRAHPLISVNYFSAWCTFVSVVMLMSLPGVAFVLPSNLKDWCYLIFLGMCGFIMQFLLAAGLQYEKSSRATNMVYMQMLFALTFDKLVWGTTPGALSIVGSSLILGSALFVAMKKETNSKKDRGSGDGDSSNEERGLMSPEHEAEEEQEDRGIPMNTLRT